MDRTLIQIKKDFEEIATKHDQINSFFWGEWQEAINQDAVNYPLMVCTLQPGSSGDNFVNVNLQITLCDKYNLEDYRMRDEVHSDMYQIFRDIWTTLKQWKFQDYLDIDGESSDTPFLAETQDLVAGYFHTINLQVYDAEHQCDIPYTGYDFEN